MNMAAFTTPVVNVKKHSLSKVLNLSVPYLSSLIIKKAWIWWNSIAFDQGFSNFHSLRPAFKNENVSQSTRLMKKQMKDY